MGNAAPRAAARSKLLQCASDIELSVRVAKDLQYTLQRHCGVGRMHGATWLEKLSEVDDKLHLSDQTIRDMDYIVDTRNKLVHVHGHDKLADREEYLQTYERVQADLIEAGKQRIDGDKEERRHVCNIVKEARKKRRKADRAARKEMVGAVSTRRSPKPQEDTNPEDDTSLQDDTNPEVMTEEPKLAGAAGQLLERMKAGSSR